MLYEQIEGLITPSKAFEMAARMDELVDPDCLSDDQKMMPSSTWMYNPFCRIHKELTSVVARSFGVDLVPTYNYGRINKQGDELPFHRDRAACEYSMTLNVRKEGNVWPFYVRPVHDKNNTTECMMNPGDAVVYKGIDVYHWRHELEDGVNHQVFFHWVNKQGRHAKEAWDSDSGGEKSHFLGDLKKDSISYKD